MKKAKNLETLPLADLKMQEKDDNLTRKNNIVRVPFYDDLKRTSEITKRNMSTLLEIAWEHLKGSKDYTKLMLGIKFDD